MLYHVVQHLEGRIIVLNITLLHTHANTPGSKLSFSRKRICPSRMYRVSPFRNAGCPSKAGHTQRRDRPGTPEKREPTASGGPNGCATSILCSQAVQYLSVQWTCASTHEGQL